MAILPRYYDCPDGFYYGGDGYCYRDRSNWDRFGRWILVGIIIVGALFIALAFACITARRRRRRGLQPYRGTGWAASGPPPGHAPAQWTGNQYNPNQPGPPNYGPPPNQGYYGNNQQPNQGYYGGQQSGVEAPNNVYQPPGGDQVYNPPSGPPPTKEGVIR